MVLLYTPSVPTAAAPQTLWTGAQHTWTGWDGSEWDISEGLSGVVLQAGVRGLHMPPIVRYSSKAPAVAGSLWRGSVTDERDVFWPVRVFENTGSQAWIEHNRRFWRTLTPSRTGVWTVTQPGVDGVAGESRSLRCRFVSETDDADDISPELVGWALYGINLVAEDPYWFGSPTSQTFTGLSGEPFFGGSGGGGFGPPFYLSSGLTMASATISNLGDVDAWPVWTVTGPCTAAQVGLDGHYVSFPLTLSSGQWIRLDTNPTSQQAIDQAGTDRTSQLGLVDFAQIPPASSVPLEITMTGTGTVSVEVTPRFWRAL